MDGFVGIRPLKGGYFLPSNLITTFLMICVGFAVAMMVILAPPVVIAKLDLATVAHNAARVASITGSVNDVENEINLDLQAEHLPTTWNGQNLFTVKLLQNGQSGTGFRVTSQPTSPSATVEIDYNAPMPFNRALTLFGGPTLDFLIPMTAKASYWNEVQYTGANP